MKLKEIWNAMSHYSYAFSRESWMTFSEDGIVRCNRVFYKAIDKVVEAKMTIVNGEIKSVEILTVWGSLGEALFGWEINSSDWVVFGKMEDAMLSHNENKRLKKTIASQAKEIARLQRVDRAWRVNFILVIMWLLSLLILKEVL